MNRNRSYNPIFIFVVILLVAVVFLEYGRSFLSKEDGAYSRNEFIQDVLRMYLTHQNVGVQGILDRIEIKNR